MNFDAFSSSQYISKLWLIQTIERILPDYLDKPEGYRIWILAGWYAVTNLILRTRNNIKIREVRSFDCDPMCETVADRLNETWVWQQWQFKAKTLDINNLEYDNRPDLVINTSIEHMDADQWFDRIPEGTLVALQASNLPHDDHTNVFGSVQEMMDRYHLREYLYEGTKYFDYNDHGFYRYMIVGIK